MALLSVRGLLSHRHVCDPPLPAEPHTTRNEFVDALAEHLGR